MPNNFLSSPPPFNGQNYSIWAVKMKSYLEANDLWKMLQNEQQPLPDDPTIAQMREHREERKKRCKALTCIHTAVSDEVFTRIMACDTSKKAWDALKEAFQSNQRTRQMQVLNLRREFELLRMKDSENIKEYWNRLLTVVNKIRLIGEQFTDQMVVQKVLVSLPEKFEAKISSLEDSRDLSEITLDELFNALQAQEQRRAIRKEEEVAESALQAKAKGPNQQSDKGRKQWNKKGKKAGDSTLNEGKNGKFPACQHCSRTNHLHMNCWFKEVECRICKQKGHIGRACKNKSQQAQVVNEEQEEQLFVASCFAGKSTVAGNSIGEAWLIDSGCTNHMTNDESIFTQLDRSYTSKVRIGNGDLIDTKGKGNVAVQCNSGVRIISDVLFVPDIDQSLLSLGQLLENDFGLNFKNKTCKIFHPDGSELFSVKMKGRSFSLDLSHAGLKAFSGLVDETELWHKRLGHFHYPALNNMQKSGLVQDLPFIREENGVCKVCQLGKQARLPFPLNMTWRATERLQLIHTDTCGPMSNPSLNGSRYYVIFVDDFSRMCWVYFLTQKSEVAAVFWKFKTLIENQSGYKIKALRSDNGTEYTSSQFNMFCEDAGIKHQLTAIYTPQQNGVSERKNRTIMDMARCLLFEKKTPKKFWAEAVNTAVFLLNRLPTKSIKNKTPFEA